MDDGTVPQYLCVVLTTQFSRLSLSTLCSEKKTPTHIFFHIYLHELFVDLNKNCSEYTQGLTDAVNVKIRYSLRSMT